MKVFFCGCFLVFAAVVAISAISQPLQTVADEKDFPKLSEQEIQDAANADEAAKSADASDSKTSDSETKGKAAKAEDKKLEKATFGNGCFWCTEAVFQRLKGVDSVRSGYIGGKVDNPTYKQVCTGRTGHAEAIEITFDPEVISFDELLEVFWRTHDPTTLNRQGNDIGTQYRSAIFYHSEKQKKLAETYKEKLDEAKAFDKPIVTEITAAVTFYPAEDYHQNYFNLNGRNPYCRAVIVPKVEKLEKVFADKLK